MSFVAAIGAVGCGVLGGMTSTSPAPRFSVDPYGRALRPTCWHSTAQDHWHRVVPPRTLPA